MRRERSTCVDGCRGKGGNGCPMGKTCTSITNDIGMCTNGTGGAGGGGGAGGAGASDKVVLEGNGIFCGVRSDGGDRDEGAPWLAAGALAALVAFRRRRR